MLNPHCLLCLVLNEVRIGGSPPIKGTLTTTNNNNTTTNNTTNNNTTNNNTTNNNNSTNVNLHGRLSEAGDKVGTFGGVTLGSAETFALTCLCFKITLFFRMEVRYRKQNC